MFIDIYRKMILYNSEIEIMIKLHKYDIEKSSRKNVGLTQLVGII